MQIQKREKLPIDRILESLIKVLYKKKEVKIDTAKMRNLIDVGVCLMLCIGMCLIDYVL